MATAWNKGLPKELQPTYGKKMSEETKRKIGEANRGRKRSEETKQQISQTLKKKFENPEAREKASNTTKELWKNPEYAEKQSQHSRKVANERWSKPEEHLNQSKRSKKLWEDKNYRDKFRTPEVRKHKSEAAKKLWKNPEYIKKQMENNVCINEKYSSFDTPIEKIVQDQLDELGIKWVDGINQKHYYDRKQNKNFLVDIYIEDYKGQRYIIECNGNRFHNYPYGLEKDLKLYKYYESTLSHRGKKKLHLIWLWGSTINDYKFEIEDYLLGIKEDKLQIIEEYKENEKRG